MLPCGEVEVGHSGVCTGAVRLAAHWPGHAKGYATFCNIVGDCGFKPVRSLGCGLERPNDCCVAAVASATAAAATAAYVPPGLFARGGHIPPTREPGARVAGLCKRGQRRLLNVLARERKNLRPQIRRDYPLNLSILLGGGKETNKDSPVAASEQGGAQHGIPRGDAQADVCGRHTLPGRGAVSPGLP